MKRNSIGHFRARAKQVHEIFCEICIAMESKACLRELLAYDEAYQITLDLSFTYTNSTLISREIAKPICGRETSGCERIIIYSLLFTTDYGNNKS